MTKQQRLYPRPTANAILAPSDYDDYGTNEDTKGMIIMGKPLPSAQPQPQQLLVNSNTQQERPQQSSGAGIAMEQDEIRIIGQGCYYNLNYIAPAQICLQLGSLDTLGLK